MSALLAVAFFGISWPLLASTRLVSDEALAATSTAAVRGRVVAVDARWDGAVNAIYTYVTLDVRQTWGLAESTRRVVLKQLGGRVGDVELEIGGQARFTSGEDVLVFLEVRPRDGTLYVSGLEQGKWAVKDDTQVGTPAAERLSTAAAFQRPGLSERQSVEVLEQRAATVGALAARRLHIIPPEIVSAGPAAPAWMHLVAGTPARWHEADSGEPVYIDTESGGHPEIPGGGLTQLARGATLWSGASSINLQAGHTRGPRCFENDESDGRISVSYQDPCGEIDDRSNTLAYGGLYYVNGDTRTVNGILFRKAVLGMVITDNVAAKFQNLGLGCYERLIAHELGHAIGFGHSADPAAIMSPVITNCSGRTTSNPLAQDDLNGLAAIYPTGAPTQPRNLAVSVTGTTVSTSWDAPAAGRIADYVLEVGSTSGTSNLGLINTGVMTSYATSLPRGEYFFRVRARNSGGASPPSTEVVANVGGPAVPLSGPTSLLARATGSTVTLQWTGAASGAPAGYLLQAGSGPGLGNLASVRVGGTVFTAAGVAPGTYYVRVHTVDGSALSAPSNEVQVVVRADETPGTPSSLEALVTGGSTVTLWWNAPASGGPFSGYRVEAGSAPGLVDLAVLSVGIHPVFMTAGVPRGVYYVRVRAVGPTVAGPPTADVRLSVP